MAKVIGAMLSLSATGKIGQKLIFQSRSSGTIAKTWAKPTNEPTAAQMAVKTRFIDSAYSWKQASLDQHILLSWKNQQALKDYPMGEKQAFIANFLNAPTTYNYAYYAYAVTNTTKTVMVMTFYKLGTKTAMGSGRHYETWRQDINQPWVQQASGDTAGASIPIIITNKTYSLYKIKIGNLWACGPLMPWKHT